MELWDLERGADRPKGSGPFRLPRVFRHVLREARSVLDGTLPDLPVDVFAR
jgi:hypothetical protein